MKLVHAVNMVKWCMTMKDMKVEKMDMKKGHIIFVIIVVMRR